MSFNPLAQIIDLVQEKEVCKDFLSDQQFYLGDAACFFHLYPHQPYLLTQSFQLLYLNV
jgi:hypothetical protein